MVPGLRSSRPAWGPQFCHGPHLVQHPIWLSGVLTLPSPPLCPAVLAGLWVMPGNRDNGLAAGGVPRWGRRHTGGTAPLFQWAGDTWFWASSLRGVYRVGPCLCPSSAHDVPPGRLRCPPTKWVSPWPPLAVAAVPALPRHPVPASQSPGACAVLWLSEQGRAPALPPPLATEAPLKRSGGRPRDCVCFPLRISERAPMPALYTRGLQGGPVCHPQPLSAPGQAGEQPGHTLFLLHTWPLCRPLPVWLHLSLAPGPLPPRLAQAPGTPSLLHLTCCFWRLWLRRAEPASSSCTITGLVLKGGWQNCGQTLSLHLRGLTAGLPRLTKAAVPHPGWLPGASLLVLVLGPDLRGDGPRQDGSPECSEPQASREGPGETR